MPPRLIPPEARYALSYAEALEEGLGLLPPDDGEITRLRRSFDSWIAAEYDMTRRIILADGSETPRMPFSTFWLVDGPQFLGRIAIRHRLSPPLEEQGGHIGYAVRRSARGRGYGHAVLQLGLAEAKKLGLSRVLLTCEEGNEPSMRIIEKAGGTLQDTITVTGAARPIRRYWLAL